MATTLRIKSFQKNLMVSIGGVFLLFAICFSVYQYQREKEYKIDIMHSRLQMFNYEMMQTLDKDSILNPKCFLDSTDALAAAFCHYLQMSRPQSEKKFSSWKDFAKKRNLI